MVLWSVVWNSDCSSCLLLFSCVIHELIRLFIVTRIHFSEFHFIIFREDETDEVCSSIVYILYNNYTGDTSSTLNIRQKDLEYNIFRKMANPTENKHLNGNNKGMILGTEFQWNWGCIKENWEHLFRLFTSEKDSALSCWYLLVSVHWGQSIPKRICIEY